MFFVVNFGVWGHEESFRRVQWLSSVYVLEEVASISFFKEYVWKYMRNIVEMRFYVLISGGWSGFDHTFICWACSTYRNSVYSQTTSVSRCLWTKNSTWFVTSTIYTTVPQSTSNIQNPPTFCDAIRIIVKYINFLLFPNSLVSFLISIVYDYIMVALWFFFKF